MAKQAAVKPATPRAPRKAPAPKPVATEALTATVQTAAAPEPALEVAPPAAEPAAAPAAGAPEPAESPAAAATTQTTDVDFSGPRGFLVTGPKAGFRRGGFAFGAEPVLLAPADFDVAEGEHMEPAAIERFLAILSEPVLQVSVALADGTIAPVHPELLEQLRAAIDERTASEEAPGA